MDERIGDVTAILHQAGAGDKEACERLFDLLYEEIRLTARGMPFVGRPGDSMQPTALANEVYLEFQRKYPKLLEGSPDSRRKFFYAVGLAMRTILRDHSRKGGEKGRQMVPLGDYDPEARGRGELTIEFTEYDDAYEKLREVDERLADVVHFRYYAGKSVEDTAALLEISTATVKRDWKLANAWIARHLGL